MNHTDTQSWLDDVFLTPAFFHDPYGLYDQLHREMPVAWSAKANAWLVCPYDQVADGLADRKLSSGARIPTLANALSPANAARNQGILTCLTLMMSFRDDPDHARLRRAVSRAFTARSLGQREEAISAIVHRLLADLPRDEPFDFVSRFAFPLPALVICNILGVPETRLADVHHWADAVVTLLSSATMSDAAADEAQEAMDDADLFIQEALAERRGKGGSDLLSELAEAEDAGVISRAEVTAMVILLLFAGFETTEGLISNATNQLIRDHRLMSTLADDPQKIPAFIEEVLRFDPPVHRQSRIAREDVQIGEQVIAAGETILFMIGASGRDPGKFQNPNTFDPDRTDASNIGFGYGPHFCLGAPLARLETRIAIEALVALPGRLESAGTATYGNLLAVRKPATLPVILKS